MRRLVLTLFAALAAGPLLAGCGDNTAPVPLPDGGPDGPVDKVTGPCLEQPTALARPPTGALPCELLPPGFVAK